MFSNINLKDAPSVAVLASEISDRTRMLNLLNALGYRGVPFPDRDTFAKAGISSRAIIVCHRCTHDPFPQLPKCYGNQPLVVVSDCSLENTVVNTLEAGAHHFSDIDEPSNVISARIKAALRHHCEKIRTTLDVAPFKFNLERRTVVFKNKIINLSPKEYELAYYLFSNHHRIVSSTELMTSVWSLPSNMDPRRIDTAACRIRKKMQLNADATGWSLKRLRQVGYELRCYTKPNCVQISAAKVVVQSPAALVAVRQIETA